eukprot:CAMPEP_0197663154 /NCGR_PEP_ID=MMETSP1338-20131121/56318_1 /TAXON_ID=43686 ORGANISM="Pelagodinium beii, Strain RCC1491" /NCGR_SAMPLE_ID=MMETSP1338 /ASSEMBLY_ACC=CAM_ASM_000754 /LENGTH=45 /DNA_ID= /DNA_START= /DNA_END= /DNA_ORIENTATION=
MIASSMRCENADMQPEHQRTARHEAWAGLHGCFWAKQRLEPKWLE